MQQFAGPSYYYNFIKMFLEVKRLRNKRQSQGKGGNNRVVNARQQTRRENVPMRKMEIRRYLGHSDLCKYCLWKHL
jgi:hypothetical protein